MADDGGAASGSDDEDFVPEPDEEQGECETKGDESESIGLRLTLKQKQAVDDAFFELFGRKQETAIIRQINKRSRRKRGKKEQILASILGEKEVAKMQSRSKKRKAEIPTVKDPVIRRKTETVEVKVIKKFAGQEIAVTERQTRTEPAMNEPQAVQKPAKPQAKGLDKVLEEMKGPTEISTVAKTSADWDNFKDKSGLEEQLEAQASSNKAFLVKQDFLKRVDLRKFELEKAERDLVRSQNKK